MSVSSDEEKNINSHLTFLTCKMTLLDVKTATITGKGQISIPKELRNKKKFKTGKKVAIICYEDHLEIRPFDEFTKRMQTAYASEKTLSKEWNNEQEDAAWKDL